MSPSVSTDILDDISSLNPKEETTPVPVATPQDAPSPVQNENAPVAEGLTDAPKEIEKPKEEPKAETPTNGQATQIDITKILSEASGGKITTTDELQKILQSNQELSEKVSKSPNLDDYTLKLHNWRQAGHDAELFHIIHDLPLDEMSAEDTLKAGLKLQNPEWAEEDINLYVKHTYGLLKDDEDGYNETTAKLGNLKMQQDARKFTEDLQKLQEMTFYADADDKEAHQFEAQRQSEWKSNLPKIIERIDKFSFNLDEKTKFDFVPNPLQKAAITQQVEKVILNAPVAYDENGIKSVTEMVRNQFLIQNINDIVQLAAKQMASVVTEQKIRETHNPSAVKPIAPVTTPAKTNDENIFEAIEKTMGY